MDSKLSSGWAWATLEELSHKISDGSHNPPKGQESGIPMLSAKNIQANKIEFDDARLISEKDYQAEISRINIAAGDVLLTIVGTIGRTAYVPEGLPKFSLQRSVAIIKPRVDGKFLAFWLRSPSVQHYLVDNAKGTAQKGIYLNSLKNVLLPLPPLAEQACIVAQLDAAMQRVEASQKRLEKLPGLLKQFRQAVLAAAVSGRLTEAWRAENPAQETGAELLARIRAERRAQWEEKQLAKMKGGPLALNDSWKQKYEEPAEPDTSELPKLPEGWAYSNLGVLKIFSLYGPRFSKEDYSENGISVLRTTDINERGKVNINTTPKIDLSREEFAKYKVEKGDLLITRTGSLGTLAVFDDDIDAIPGAYLIHYRLLNSELTPLIFFFLKSTTGNQALMSGGAGTGIVNINAPTIEAIPIPIPPLFEQQEIIRLVTHYFDLADQLEARFEQAAAMVEQIPQALLAKAFSGQLVPQDPNDEPASVLLEKLRNAPTLTKAKRVPKSPKSNLQLEFAVPQSLLDILNQHPDGISPEKLFSLSGFTDADVDFFYQELAKLQPQLEETKPTGETAKTWPKTSTTLRIKSQADAN